MLKTEPQEAVIEIPQDAEESQSLGWKWKGTVAIIYFTALINGKHTPRMALRHVFFR